MLSALAVSQYVLPPPTVFVAENLHGAPGSRSTQLGRLAALAASVARGRAAVKDQSDLFDQLYREAERTELTPKALEEGAQILLENEQKVAAVLVPQIEHLERNLARKRIVRAVRRTAEDALDIAQTWLELYQNLRICLLKLASDRRAAARETGSPILSNTDDMERYLRRVAEG